MKTLEEKNNTNFELIIEEFKNYKVDFTIDGPIVYYGDGTNTFCIFFSIYLMHSLSSEELLGYIKGEKKRMIGEMRRFYLTKGDFEK